MSLMDRCLPWLIEGKVRKKNKIRYASKIELKYGNLVRYGSRYGALQKFNWSTAHWYGTVQGARYGT